MTDRHLVTPLHLERSALICVPRKSTGRETLGPEPTEPPADLVRLARSLGWPSSRIVTAESLMGQSEGGWTERALLERLDDEVSEWRVGVLLGLDSAGIASDSTGWFQLLDSCRATGTLLLSGDRIHAPALQSELVVLGDKELTDFDDWIVRGLLFGYEHEADNRFDLSFELPVGYVKEHLAIRKNPSPAIREVVEKTFERFLEFETAHATARSLSGDGFNLPYRRGRDGSVEWGKATPDRVADLVRSPCMAGAYLYGRCRLQRSLGARESPGRVLVAGISENRSLLVMNHHEPYVAWNEWIKVQGKLAWDVYGKLPDSVRWQGSRLLDGLAICGCCNGKMEATDGEDWRYECTPARPVESRGQCLSVAGSYIDCAVARRFLSAVLAGGFEASRVAVAKFPATENELARRQWLELDRCEYEAALSYRHYRDVNSEYELVARKLRRTMESADIALEAARERFARTRAERPDLEMPALLERFARLGARLEDLWNAPSISDVERRDLLRILLDEVELRTEPEHGWVRILMRWRGGATDEQWLPLR